jgi:multisubunit Na+/H+ antiporter MnhG subunit
LLGEPLGWRELAALTLICAALFMVLVGPEGIKTINRAWRKTS